MSVTVPPPETGSATGRRTGGRRAGGGKKSSVKDGVTGADTTGIDATRRAPLSDTTVHTTTGATLATHTISNLTATISPVVGRVKTWWGHVAKALNPVWVKVRPVLAVIRPAGWVSLAVVVVALVGGLMMGWAELIVAAIFFGVLLLGAVVFVLGRSTYDVGLDLSRLRVRVGTDAFGGLTITNTSDRALMPSIFILPVGKGQASFQAPRLKGHEKFEESFQIPTARRAVIPLGPVRSTRGDPLGLLRRDVVWTDVQELFVHPATVVLGASAAGFMRDLEGRPTDTLSSSDIAFHALRDYEVGDDLRHVHWKTSARIGKLMVRQFEETRRSHLVVCLSLTPSDYATEWDFELAVSAAASLGQQAILEEKDVTIQVPGKRLDTRTGARMLDDFSRLEMSASVGRLESAAIDVNEAVTDASSAVIISGTKMSAARFHAAAIRFPVDVMTVALRCEVGAHLSRGVIGATTVLTVGDLHSLPRVLRSMGG